MAKIVVAFALVLAACGADVNEKTLSAETPSEVAERFARALNEQDWGVLYDSLCNRTRQRMDRGLSMDADDGSGVSHSSRRNRWVQEFERLLKMGRRIAGEGPYRVTQVKHQGDGVWAYAAIQTGPSGDIETIKMLREGDNWRLVLLGPGHGAGRRREDDQWWLPQ